MNYQVRISEPAETDVRSNFQWWNENHSAEQASLWVDRIEKAIQSLERIPFRCPVASEAAALGIPVRCLFFGVSSRFTHRILFTVEDETVDVLRILNTKQNLIADSADFH